MWPERRWKNLFSTVSRSCSLSKRQSIWLGSSPQRLQTIKAGYARCCVVRDFPAIKKVRAKILGLPKGAEVTQEDFDSLPDFQLRWVADETHPPTIVGEYWINHLNSKDCLAKCKPNAFKYAEGWLPLYTRACVTKQISDLGPLLKTQGDSPLIAIIPPEFYALVCRRTPTLLSNSNQFKGIFYG